MAASLWPQYDERNTCDSICLGRYPNLNQCLGSCCKSSKLPTGLTVFSICDLHGIEVSATYFDRTARLPFCHISDTVDVKA